MVVGGNFVTKKSALITIGGFDTSIEFYGEDTNIAKRLKNVGNVLFDFTFIVQTSARRLESQGLLKTAALYMTNYVTQAALKKTVTHSYTDIR